MPKSSFNRWLIAALVVVFFMLIAGGVWFYRTHEQLLQQHAEDGLLAIAQLKVEEIEAWRAERLGDATVLTESPLFLDGVARWIANPQAAESEALLAQFRALQNHYHYYDVLLVGVDGNALLSLSGKLGPLHEDAAQILSYALQDRRPMLTDLYLSPGDLQVHIDAVAPLFSGSGLSAEPIGAIILQSNASQFLYPLIQSWPTLSSSAETLLVRRDGDSVLFLNELRHQKGTGLSLRIPLSQTDVPAVKAVLGIEGVVQGQDYRGVEVLSVIMAVPDSPWFVAAKMDRDEVFSDWHARSLLILGLLLGTFVAVGTVGGVIWQSRQKFYYRTLFEAEKARQESEMRYQTTLLSIGDGVMVTDVEGQVVLLNPAAEALTGWLQNEAHGKPLEEVFHIVNEETRQPVENPVRQVVREGIVVGLANHTLLIAKGGREIPIADSGAPVFDAASNLTGVVLVFREQTDERAAQRALQESEAYIRTILDNLPVGIAVNSVDPTVIFSYMNDNFVRYYRTTREALATPDTFWEAVYEDAEYRNVIKRRVLEDVISGDPERMHWDDVPITRQGEETRFISATNTPILGKPLMLSTVWDTTERKRAEEALRESERFARSTLDGLSAHIAILDEKGTLLAVNNRWRAFAEANPPVSTNVNEGANYLAVCDQASGSSSEGAAEFASAIRAVIDGTLDHFEWEYSCHSPTEQRWFVSLMTRFPGAGPVRVVVAHENITRLKRAELKLAEERNLLRTLIDNLPDHIYVKDSQGRFTIRNEAGARHMGAASTDEVIGKTDFDYYPIELAQQYATDDAAVIQSGQALIYREEPIIGADGTQGWILTSKVPLRDNQGHTIGLVGIGRDITERKQAEKTLIQRSKEIDVLYQASQQLSRSLDLDEIYEIAHHVISQTMDCDTLLISSFDEASQIISCLYVYTGGKKIDVDTLPLIPLAIEDPGMQSQVIRSGETLYYQGALTKQSPIPENEEYTRSALLVPLKYQGRITGLVQVYSDQPDGYTVHDKQILEALTNQFATSLSNAHLYKQAQDEITERKRAEEALREHNRRLNALNRVGIALAQTLTLPRICQTAYEHVSQLMDCACFGISLYDSESQTLQETFMLSDGELLDTSRFPPLVVHENMPLEGRARAVIVQQPEIVNDMGRSVDDRIPRSALYLPMVTQGKTIGLLEVQSYQQDAYGSSDIALLGPVANQISLAIQNARLFADLEAERRLLEQRVIERTAQLNHTKDRIETILNSSSDIIILCRPDGRIDQVNPAFDTTFGWEPDEVYNQPVTRFVVPEHAAMLEQTLAAVVASRQPQRLEMAARSKDGGRSFEVDIVLSPIVRHDTQLLGVVCSLRDITERRRLEAQLRQMLEHEIELGELKSRYVSMAAHDLRNPLAVIQTTLQVIEKYHERLNTEERQAKYNNIHRSLKVMVDLLNDILTFGQAGSGKLKFEPGPLDLIRFAQDLITELQQAIGNGYRVKLSHPDTCDIVHMDDKLLRHILGNLLSNALKYSPVDSPVTLAIESEAHTVTFRIQDQGIGIPQADQEHLFEAFHRAANVGSIPGTGLGMAIIKQSIDLHGGTIWFESEEGGGTTFTVSFPRSQPEDVERDA